MPRIASPKTVTNWRRHIALQKSSGLPVAAFCRKAEIPVARFRWWRTRLARQTPPRPAPGFVMVSPLTGVTAPQTGVTIHLPGNIRIVAYPQTERQLLADTITLLRTQS